MAVMETNLPLLKRERYNMTTLFSYKSFFNNPLSLSLEF